ncbi:MAG: ABC transporter ATP-binding protein [Planctomycetota bacterium]
MSEAALLFEDEHKAPGRLNLGLWRRIAANAAPYRRPLAVLVGCGMTVASVDVLIPYLTGLAIDEAVKGEVTAWLVGLGVAYTVAFVLLSACIYGFIRAAGIAATGIARDLRERSFAKLQELSFSFFDTRPVGWLVTRLTSDVDKVSSLLPWFLLDLVWGSSLVLGISLAMLWLDLRLGLVVLAVMPALVLVSRFFQRRLLESSRRVRRTYAVLAAQYNEGLQGVRATKELVREQGNLEEFQEQSSAMYRYSFETALLSAIYLPLVMSLGALGAGLALWRGGVRVELGGLSLGTLVAFVQYAAFLTQPIQELAERFTQLQAAQAAAERVQGLLDTVPEIKDDAAVLAAIERQALDRAAGVALDGVALDGGPARVESVEFVGVDFAYKPEEPVLQGFDLRVEAGETVALVGATGGGKSTIVSLLARFYEPTAGEIRINGTDYRRRSLSWWQSNIGVVLQVPHLFSGTVREAIRYGRLDATDEEIEAAARRVGAHAFISRLPGGYQAEVGEGGSKLSTGQRQLVSLARAVLADPQVFIMDEATSSVDTETERLIQGAIDEVLAGRIAFVIAHRLSTIRGADKILVIDGGRVVEAGGHAELLRKRGRYHALYTRQAEREVSQVGA